MTACNSADRGAEFLSVERLTTGYGYKPVLQELDLAIRGGEFLAILGANGAGKSTLLRAIMGFTRVSSGRIRIFGADVTDEPTHRRVSLGISYLMQGSAVFPSLSVRENIEVAVSSLKAGHRSEAIRQCLYSWPELRQHSATRAGLLSGGQQQVLAIAMTLARKPRLLLLDEPSAGLAPRVAAAILMRLAGLSRDSDVITVVAEHRVREVLPVATRAIILNNGRIYAETFAPSDWLEVERLERLIFGPPPPE